MGALPPTPCPVIVPCAVYLVVTDGCPGSPWTGMCLRRLDQEDAGAVAPPPHPWWSDALTQALQQREPTPREWLARDLHVSDVWSVEMDGVCVRIVTLLRWGTDQPLRDPPSVHWVLLAGGDAPPPQPDRLIEGMLARGGGGGGGGERQPSPRRPRDGIPPQDDPEPPSKRRCGTPTRGLWDVLEVGGEWGGGVLLTLLDTPSLLALGRLSRRYQRALSDAVVILTHPNEGVLLPLHSLVVRSRPSEVHAHRIVCRLADPEGEEGEIFMHADPSPRLAYPDAVPLPLSGERFPSLFALHVRVPRRCRLPFADWRALCALCAAPRLSELVVEGHFHGVRYPYHMDKRHLSPREGDLLTAVLAHRASPVRSVTVRNLDCRWGIPIGVQRWWFTGLLAAVMRSPEVRVTVPLEFVLRGWDGVRPGDLRVDTLALTGPVPEPASIELDDNQVLSHTDWLSHAVVARRWRSLLDWAGGGGVRRCLRVEWWPNTDHCTLLDRRYGWEYGQPAAAAGGGGGAVESPPAAWPDPGLGRRLLLEVTVPDAFPPRQSLSEDREPQPWPHYLWPLAHLVGYRRPWGPTALRFPSVDARATMRARGEPPPPPERTPVDVDSVRAALHVVADGDEWRNHGPLCVFVRLVGRPTLPEVAGVVSRLFVDASPFGNDGNHDVPRRRLVDHPQLQGRPWCLLLQFADADATTLDALRAAAAVPPWPPGVWPHLEVLPGGLREASVDAAIRRTLGRLAQPPSR